MASGLPHGLISFGPNANCTLALCPVESSLLGYRPSVPANATFIALFSVALVIHAVQGIWTRRWGFTGSILCGCILEILGYAGRLMLYDNPFSFNGILLQIICITIAPVFFCSAIYVLLSQVINAIDRSISRYDPRVLYWTFIPCDIVSLILQAAGGGLSVTAGNSTLVQQGVNISLAGLAFQVATLIIFCGLFVDYLIRVNRSAAKTKLNQRMMIFLVFLFLSIFFILVRCAYRIAELREGYSGDIFREEAPFIALESVMMTIGVFCLNVGHPGLGFSDTGFGGRAFGKHKAGHSISSAEVVGMKDMPSEGSRA